MSVNRYTDAVLFFAEETEKEKSVEREVDMFVVPREKAHKERQNPKYRTCIYVDVDVQFARYAGISLRRFQHLRHLFQNILGGSVIIIACVIIVHERVSIERTT